MAKFSRGRQDAECTLLLGTYLELADLACLKQKELLVNTGTIAGLRVLVVWVGVRRGQIGKFV